MSQKSQQIKMLVSSISYMFFTMLSRISGFVREILIARYLGVGIESDAFYAAWRIPNSFRKLLADGGVSAAFVPLFIKIRTSSITKANIFSGNVAVALFIITCIVTILVETLAPKIIYWITPGFADNSEKMQLTVLLARIVMPYLPLISMVALLGGICNGIRIFSYFAAIQVIQNLSMILSAIIFGKLPNFVYFLSASAICGGFIQVGIMLFACYKNDVFPVLKFQWLSDIWIFFKNLIPVLISQGAMQINIFVGGIFASLSPGATSYLAYTDRIGLFATTMIGYTLGTISLPLISKKIALNDKIGAMQIQQQCVKWAILLAIPATTSMIMLSQTIVSALYLSDKFTLFHAEIVSKMLQIYAFGVPFIAINRIFNASFFANSNTKTPMYIGIFSATLNVILNIILIKYFSFYAMIISTTVCSICESFLLWIFLKIKYNITGIIYNNIKYIVLSLFFSIIISLEAIFITTNINFNTLPILLLAVGVAIFSYILLLIASGIIKIKDIKMLITKN